MSQRLTFAGNRESMAKDPVVRFHNVSKRFHMTSERPQTILETLIALLKGQRRQRRTRELWALRELSFDIARGECLGIIGRNGSGKSTLLKLVARILRPTGGQITVSGRVSALLELGAGFHPDLTGRENIYLNGAVLGLSKKEIDARFADIIDFSELAEFIDVPVKHYSSGMYMRLGFSIAIHVDPDILLVDEILAVGDQAFQSKCVDRIYQMKQRDTTIILVSHNLDMVRNLCTHLLWIEHGRLRRAGPVESVAAHYVAASYERQEQPLKDGDDDTSFKRWGTREIEITHVRFLDGDGEETQTFQTNDELIVEIGYVAHRPVQNPEFGLAIFRQDGVHVNGPNSRLGGLDIGTIHGQGVIRYHMARLPLLPARYQLTAAVYGSRLPVAYDHHDQAYTFRVTAGGTEELHGLIAVSAEWEWQPETENVKTVTNDNEVVWEKD
jgi:lipopolysaccharide transport system ATP-binding protein